MSVTQFAMVEELAFLIRDNLPCKHLVLSMEEAFVTFLQEEASSDGVLELDPMNSYDRLLLHRLADIFGFSHHSIGEGDERHLILERCPETSIPSILVSDLLWQFDGFESPVSRQLLRRDETSPVSVLKVETPKFQFSLEEREAAYLAARERIFSRDGSGAREPVQQKTRNVPVVARRMIAHALGQRINSSSQEQSLKSTHNYGEQNERKKAEKVEVTKLSLETHQGTNVFSGRNENQHGKLESKGSSNVGKKVSPKLVDKTCAKVSVSQSGRNEMGVQKPNLKEEHIGAAKRMFAHALGFQSAKDGNISKSSERKQTTE